ncbi:MAG TPA: hypothetical protein VKQ30_20780 [Ktedonobacterales bacterium]|nr:hypothetical protein [Ktedonobacterales bacterium]
MTKVVEFILTGLLVVEAEVYCYTNASEYDVRLLAKFDTPLRHYGGQLSVFGRPVAFADADMWARLQLLVLAGHATHLTI